MEDTIKFKNSNKSFYKYLENKGMSQKGAYTLPRAELETFFEFKTNDDSINFSILEFNKILRLSILEHEFLFYNDIKKIKEIDANGNQKIINFQFMEEEEEYLQKIKENPNLYNLKIKINNNYITMNNEFINIIELKNVIYEVNEKQKLELKNLEFTPFYEDYIFIINRNAYKNFVYIKSPLRDKLFEDLNIFLNSKFMDFFPICGHSGSGKTTSILYYLKENRGVFNMFYINCYTMLRNELKNEEIKNILIYELKLAVNNNANIINNFTSFLEKNMEDRKERNNDFIFNLIKKLFDIYNNEIISKKLNIIIDQYSSKFDKDNSHIYSLIDQLKSKTNKIKIILISSMNNTCVSRNMEKSLLCEFNHINEKFIKYYMYGQFFDIISVISNEKDEMKEIMINMFDNSALIYYILKSKLLNEKDKIQNNNNNTIFQFIEEEKEVIKNEMKIFYKINLLNTSYKGKEKENLINNILYALKTIQNKTFFNYENLPDLFEKLPFKYFKILYYEIDVSHPEFINLLPKNVKQKLLTVSIVSSSQKINMLCSLKNRLRNEYQKLNEFLTKFKGEKTEIISFFTVEPLYQIIEVCLKELIVYYMIEEHLYEELYLNLKGGLKGYLFEYILINYIKSSKKFINIKFELVENINSIVPNSFSITKFSHRLLIKKNYYQGKKEERKANNSKNKSNELIIEEKDNDNDNNKDESVINSDSKKCQKLSNNLKINTDKKKYSKTKDKNVFIELKKIIDETFHKDDDNDKKYLQKKNIYLNQLNSNGKYFDGGLLIYIDEKNQLLNFKLILIQFSINREKNKIFNQKEIKLISTYIKEHLEKLYQNINIIEILPYYIIDGDQPSQIIVQECKSFSIQCLGFKINKKTFNSFNDSEFKVDKFSKFNSCFILKSDININKDIADSIDKEVPILFDKIIKDKLEKFYEPLFDKDLNISDNYYIYKNLQFDLNFCDYLTEYAFLIYMNEKEFKYIILNKYKILDYSAEQIKNIDDVDIDRENFKLITFLIPIRLFKNYD